MHYEYKPEGVCSSLFVFEIENNIIQDMNVIGGCHGNSQGICALAKGRDIDEIISKFKNIPCRPNGTSCPDQISRALEKYKALHM